MLLFVVIAILILQHFYNSYNQINFSNDYIDKKIIIKYNVTEKDWCSVTCLSYMVLFFLCLDNIPNISMFIGYIIY